MLHELDITLVHREDTSNPSSSSHSRTLSKKVQTSSARFNVDPEETLAIKLSYSPEVGVHADISSFIVSSDRRGMAVWKRVVCKNDCSTSVVRCSLSRAKSGWTWQPKDFANAIAWMSAQRICRKIKLEAATGDTLKVVRRWLPAWLAGLFGWLVWNLPKNEKMKRRPSFIFAACTIVSK